MAFENLPTLGEMNAQRRAEPKPSKLARAKQNKKDDDTDAVQLRKWAQAVKTRDRWLDRFDEQPVLKTLKLLPRRAEAHHIAPRNDLAVRYDVRNGLTLSMEHHARAEAGQLRIIGTKFFTVNGKRYIDATYPVKFKKVGKW